MQAQSSTDAKVVAVLRAAAADAEEATRDLADGGSFGAMVRDAQVRAAATRISAILVHMWEQVGKLTEAGQEDARRAALEQSFNWDKILLATGISSAKRAAMKEGLLSASQFNVEAALERVYFTRIPLSQRVYRSQELSNGWLDRLINSGLARGSSPQELARSVRSFVRPDTPGGVAYAAKRLSRTEINNAYHAVTIVHNEDKPWNLGMQWNLSGSHPTVDICDTLSRQNKHGLGKGVYRKTETPRKPHPQCLCYVIPKTMTPEQWLKAYNSGKFNAYIENTYAA